MGQRCQISDYEHLENVNVINANQTPLTVTGWSSGLGEGGSGEIEPEEKAKKKHTRFDGLCSGDPNRCAILVFFH